MLTLITAPAVEPVSLAEARNHLRIPDDLTADDALISGLIAAARQVCEARLRRALVTQTWELALGGFYAWERDAPGLEPAAWGPGAGWPTHADPCRSWGQEEIPLPPPPLQSVTSLIYVDPDGASQTLATSAYQVVAGTPGLVIPTFATTWPATRRKPRAVLIRFIAGYGLAAAVPDSIKAAIRLMVGHWYEAREAVSVGQGITVQELPLAVEALLAAEDWGHYS